MPEERRASEKDPIIIRKYANRRLYNTATAGFVTLDDLRRLVVAGEDFIVIDVQTGTDITASVLAQIVAEQETRGESLLPLTLLKQAISFYEKGMSAPFSNYLEQSMSTLAQSFGHMGELGEIGRRNIEILQRSFEMFAPRPPSAERPADKPTQKAPAPETGSAGTRESAAAAETNLEGQVRSLKEELVELQRRLDALGNAPKRARKRKD
jgi:polyhydroxyalkanoate synthesis repressor PhaR